MKEMKKNETEEIEKLKKEQKELEQKIMMMLASYMDFFLEKTQKREVIKEK